MSAEPKLKVAVCIINYRTAEMTLQCVESALVALKGINGRVVVVDNDSGDGSIAVIEEWLGQQPKGTPVDFIKSTTNSGFSGGNNQCIAACDAEYYLLLNSDALVRPEFFRGLLAAADNNPDAGLFAPLITYDDGERQISCFRFHSPQSEFLRSAQLGIFSRLLHRRAIPITGDPTTADIEWASFACIALRQAMVTQIGPMDEGYFLYFEDVEYCMRARKSGWKIMHVPKAQAIHFRGGSGPVKALIKQKARLPRYYYCSRTRFLYQGYGRLGLLAANLLWYVGQGFQQMGRLAGRKFVQMPRGEGKYLWTNFSNPLGPRT
jgi:GT2 family glycosyltransferase